MTARFFGRKRRGRSKIGGGLAGLVAGAGLMYFLEPRRGPGRRSHVAEKTGRVLRDVEETVEAGARDLQHRARGLAHEARARVAREGAPDEVVAERVRAKLGRLTAHPGAIQVTVRAGQVELAGLIFSAEQAQVIRGVRLVRGVRGVDDRLEPHETAEGVPALQGAGPRPGPWSEPLQRSWAPSAKLLATTVGAALLGKALFGRGLLRIPSGIVGAALLGRVMGESEAVSREARRVQRAASELATGDRERRGEQERHRGAWHPEPEVQEVKTPSELEPGIASASPRPTVASHVDPGGGGGWKAAGERGGEAEGREVAGDVGSPSEYVAPAEGAPVREEALGAVLPREPEDEARESRGEGEPGAAAEGGAAPRKEPS